MTGTIRIGTQAWNYDAWIGPFYPLKTRSADFLTVYARAFEAVEVDSTFYAIPAAKTVQGWAQRTPSNFRFALKMPQEITHQHRLRGAEDRAREFCDRARELGNQLGAILIQLGPDFTVSELPTLAQFLPTLPTDMKFAIEFRHRSWAKDDAIACLSEHNVAIALTEGPWIPRKQMLMFSERPTADFSYIRLMGNRSDIVDYSRIQVDRSRELEQWATVISRLAADGRMIYAFTSNYFAGHSPASARDLQRLLHQAPVDPDLLGDQMSLF